MSVAFIDTARSPEGQPEARAYYRMFPTESLGGGRSLTVETPVALPAMTASGLLGSIVEHCGAGQSIVVVDHGMALGPSMPLTPALAKKKIYLQHPVLDLFARHEAGEVSAGEVAAQLDLTSEEFGSFWTLVQQVREMKLAHVAIRACDVGRNVEVLNLLKRFFGCSRISAPKELDVFVTLKPDIGPTSIASFRRLFPQQPIQGQEPNRWAIHVSALLEFSVAFESQQAVQQWVASHLPGGGHYSSGDVPAHGVQLSVGAKHFAFAGEPEYDAQMAVA